MRELSYSSEEIAEMLDWTNWSKDFSWNQMKRMCQFFSVYGAEKDELLFQQGGSTNSMGILLKGTLLVIRDNNGKQSQLAKLRAPQTFGEISLLDGQPRSASLIAGTALEYLLITKDDMDDMAEKHSLVAYKLLWKISYILSQRLRNTSGQLSEYLEIT